ncbi:MAG: hypothetical protein P1V97_03835, partial [Planctomycetota bacterium]|nr:hypothetical protein [Planctomycetota bacterium]
MSVWNYVFDNEYKQRYDIENLRQASNNARRRQSRTQRETKDRVSELEQEVGELALVCRTLLTVLRESGSIDEKRFQQVFKDIDAEDGVIDGRVTPETERHKIKAPKSTKRRPDPSNIEPA